VLTTSAFSPTTNNDRALPQGSCKPAEGLLYQEENTMATDPRKRQKQYARKTAKRKAAVAAKKATEGSKVVRAGTRQMAVAASAPLHECLMPQELFETGMGTVVVSRAMPNGNIGASFFLLDVFCLGVKDAYFVAVPRTEYGYRLAGIAHNETLTPLSPACARKLVEEAEAYASNLGFSPHPDYQLARKIFADIDAAACTTSFTFGKDGKPFFIAGPHDTPRRVHSILDTLTQRCGPDGFHYLLVLGEPPEFDDNDDAIDVEYETLDGKE
jgi:hypothetical protein